MMLTLALLAGATGLLAGGLGLAEGWYAHAAVDLFLLCYLIYLRRQVRVEQSIRARRAARTTRRGHPAETDHELDERRGERGADGGRARRGRGRRPTVADAVAARQAREAARHEEAGADEDLEYDESADYESDDESADYESADYESADYEPPGDPVRREASPTGHGELINDEPALPRLRPAAPPERPRGTVVVELDDEDPELHDLDTRQHRGYRHAAGQ